MTDMLVPVGELCLQTPAARCQPGARDDDKATVTGTPAVMSATRRFWAKVDKDGPVNRRRPELGPCWLWTGSAGVSPKGERTYGHIMVATKRMGAHRFSFLLHGGTVPVGHDVMHLCDVKACVRPTHLAAGTRAENMLDGFASPANQGVCAGENNGRARLTWTDVHAIRAASEKQTVLAERYGVTQAAISQIRSGRKWPESRCPLHEEVAA